MVIRIEPITGQKPPRKLANAELHFTDGELEGLTLVGFAVWEAPDGSGRRVTFPSRSYTLRDGERHSYALLRPAVGTDAEKRVRSLVLDAYDAFEQREPEVIDEDGFSWAPDTRER